MKAVEPRKYTPPLTPSERKAIQTAFLTEPGISRVALAKRFGRDRATIAHCLDGEDFKDLRKSVHEARKDQALAILRENVVEAAEAWGKTFPKAVKKGNHKPMDAYLKAAGVIEQADGPRIVVQVGVKLTGAPEP